MTAHSPVEGRPVDLLTWTGRSLRKNAAAAARLGRWALHPERFPAPQRGDATGLLHERRVPLTVRPDADPRLEAGKRTNVTILAGLLDRLALTPAHPFSFARAVGPMTADRGFVAGRELRGGCLVPTVGGGACLASNALFAVAVDLGWTVLERHGHSLAHPDVPMVELDATLRWPDVDLRFAPDRPVVLRTRVEGDALRIQVLGAGPAPTVAVRRVDIQEERLGDQVFLRDRILRSVNDGPWHEVAQNRRKLVAATHTHRNCWTCNETGCWERAASLAAPVAGA